MKLKIAYLFFLASATASTALQAQSKADIEAIKQFCGCHEVQFSFTETFSPDTAYHLHEAHSSKGLEWVELVEESKGKFVLQHLLIVPDGKGGSHIVKHWRQDWLYENRDLHRFVGDKTWKYEQLSRKAVKGQWTQKVYQVDDSPRYQASGTWVHLDGKHYWETYADTPLPRREFTKRSDYDILRRRNRHEIFAWGWSHEQDNDKIALKQGQEQLIAQEKGMNTYRRTEDKACQAALDYWKENKNYWADVRSIWTEVMKPGQDLKLSSTVEGKPLYSYVNPKEGAETARTWINRFVESKASK